jgi:lipopolysaccharide/colanic/teichoic acid biosynthesis glycosyltransferase
MPKHGLEYLLSQRKRQFDLLGSLAISLALAPLAGIVTSAAAFDNRSLYPIYEEQRMGGHTGGTFTIRKFRTLTKNVEGYLPGQTYGTFDPRASRIAQLLRCSGLDEMPQLCSVLAGNMSLVGPRPLHASELERSKAADPDLFATWHPLFQQVLPGMTGRSQIYRHHFRHNGPQMLIDSMRMDVEYFESASLTHDMQYLSATPIHLLRANIAIVDNRNHLLDVT